MAAAALLLGCATHPAVPDQPVARPVPYRTLSATFGSGLRTVIYEDRSARRAWVGFSYGAGTRDENPHQAGLAHLVEHLSYRSRPAGPGTPDLFDRLELSGLPFNGVTTPDSTDFFVSGSPDKLGELLHVEAARMAPPLANITEQEFEVERDVVANELRLRGGSAGERADLVLSALTHPGSNPLLQSAELAHLTLADAREWAAQQYRPESCIVVVVAPAPAEALQAYVAQQLGDLGRAPNGAPVPPRTRPVSAPLPPVTDELIPLHAPVTHPEVWMAWRLPGASDPAGIKALALAPLAQIALNARFHKDKRVRGTSAELLRMDDMSLLLEHVTLEHVEDAADIADLLRHPIALNRLGPMASTVQRILLVQNLREREYPPLSRIAQHLRARGKGDYLGDWNAEIQDQIQELTPSGGLQPVQPQALLVVPSGGAAEVAEAPRGEAELLDTTGADAVHATPRELAATGARPGLDKAVTHTLSNGMRVVVMPWRGYPLVDMRLVLDTSVEEELHDAARVGVRIRRGGSPGTRQWTFRGSAPAGNLGNLLLEPWRWLDDGSPTVKDAMMMRERLHQANAWRVKHAQYLLEPDPWFAKPLDDRALDALTWSQLDAWWWHATRPQRATLVLTGEVEPGPELWSTLEGWFASWKDRAPSAPPPAPPPPLELPTAQRIQFREVPEATEVGISVHVAVPDSALPSPATLPVLTRWLELDLTRKLREEQGLAYFVGVGSVKVPSGREVVLTTAVDARRAADALSELLGELRRLKSDGAPDAELVGVEWVLERSLDHRFTTVSEVADALEDEVLRGAGPDFWERYPDVLANVRADDLREAAQASSIGAEQIVLTGTKATYDALAARGLQMRLVPEMPRNVRAGDDE